MGEKAVGGNVNRGLGRGNRGATVQLDLDLSICARPGFWCSTPWRTHSRWLVDRELWDKDTVTSAAALLTGHLLKA